VHPGIRDSFGHYIPGRDDGSPEPVPGAPSTRRWSEWPSSPTSD